MRPEPTLTGTWRVPLSRDWQNDYCQIKSFGHIISRQIGLLWLQPMYTHTTYTCPGLHQQTNKIRYISSTKDSHCFQSVVHQNVRTVVYIARSVELSPVGPIWCRVDITYQLM